MPSSSIPPATSSAAAAPSIGPAIPPNVVRLPATSQLEALLTVIRDQKTARSDFIFYSNRIIRLLVEEGLNHLPVTESTVTTPTGLPYRGELQERRQGNQASGREPRMIWCRKAGES